MKYGYSSFALHILALAATFFLAAPVTGARAEAPPPPHGTMVTAEQFDLFVKTNREISDIIVHYHNKSLTYVDEAIRQALYAQLTTDIRSAINARGMTVEEYNIIAAAIWRSPSLFRHYNGRMPYGH